MGDRRLPYERLRLARSKSPPCSPSMLPSDLEDVKNEIGTASAAEETMRCMKQGLQPMQDNVNQLNNRQNVMERQAELIVSELKLVVNTLTTQQKSPEGVLEQQSRRAGQLEHRQSGIVGEIIDEEAVRRRIQAGNSARDDRPEQQETITSTIHDKQRRIEEEVANQHMKTQSLAGELQHAFGRFQEIKQKLDAPMPGEDMRQLGARRKSPPHGGMGTDQYNDQCLGNPRRETPSSQTLTVHPNVRAPPKFQPESYARRGEELSFWVEIHAFASDSALIAEMALISTDVLRAVLLTLLRDAKTCKEQRTMEKVLSVLGKEFLKDSTDRTLS